MDQIDDFLRNIEPAEENVYLKINKTCIRINDNIWIILCNSLILHQLRQILFPRQSYPNFLAILDTVKYWLVDYGFRL